MKYYLVCIHGGVCCMFKKRYSVARSSIHPLLSVQPDQFYKNLAIQNKWKYCFINYHNTIHVSVLWQITQTPKTKTLLILFYH